MLTGINTVNLSDMIEKLGEDSVKTILSDFCCPYNKDVEDFLLTKSIEFSKRGFSRTHLVFMSYKEMPVIVGYFTLANKHIVIKKGAISNTKRKSITQFGDYVKDLDGHVIAAPLLAQFGKNYKNEYNRLISGDELLQLAIDKISGIQFDLGGKLIYLECEENPKLIAFYKRNGFEISGKRLLDKDETNIRGNYLLQMVRYLRD